MAGWRWDHAFPPYWGIAFLPWHRELCNRLEVSLREVDPMVFLHYWYWTRDPRNSPDGAGGFVNLFTTIPERAARAEADVRGGDPRGRPLAWPRGRRVRAAAIEGDSRGAQPRAREAHRAGRRARCDALPPKTPEVSMATAKSRSRIWPQIDDLGGSRYLAIPETKPSARYRVLRQPDYPAALGLDRGLY